MQSQVLQASFRPQFWLWPQRLATTNAFLKWKAGQTKGMIGQTVAKVAARSEGARLDEVEALDVLPAVAALNEHQDLHLRG